MSSFSKALVVVVTVLGVLLAGWVYLTRTESPDVQPSVSGAPSQSIREPEIPETRSETTTVLEEQTRTSKRILHVPDNRADKISSESERESEEGPSSISSELESALGGDVEKGLLVADRIGKCAALPPNEQILEAKIQHFYENPNLPLPSNSPIVKFNGESPSLAGSEHDSFELWSSDLRRKFERCRPLHEMSSSGLRDRLKSLAENGNAVARFLFSLMPPSQPAIQSKLFREYLEYESLAREFTIQNLEEHHPLGLLALGMSYRKNLFTPLWPPMGSPFVLAATQCGLEAEWIGFVLDGFSQFEIEMARETAQEIAEEFCF